MEQTKKFNLLEGMKAKGVQLTADEENFVKGLETEIDAALKQATEGKMPIDEFNAKFMEQFETAKAGMATEETVQGLKTAMMQQGLVITALKSGNATPIKAKTIEDAVNDNWKQIQSLSKNKTGSINISLKAAVTMTTGNTLDSSVIEGEDGTDVTESFRVDGLVKKRRDKQYIFDIADRTMVNEVPENIIWYEEGSEQGNFAVIAESVLKPLVSLDIVKNLSEVKKAAGKVVLTEEMLKFRQGVYQMIRTLFNDKVLRDYQNILTTSLLTDAASYVGTTLDGTIENPNDYHAIGAVAAQLETLNYSPDVLILNPQDKWRIMLSQDSTGQFYTSIPVQGANGQVQMMSFRTITSTKMTAGEAILGEGDTWKIEEEAVQMRMGYGLTMNGGTAESDFDYNRFRIIGELFFHDYIATNNTGSFVKFNFATVKAALLAPEI